MSSAVPEGAGLPGPGTPKENKKTKEYKENNMKIKNDGASGLTELKSKLKDVRSTGKEPTHLQPSQRFRSRRPAKISGSELKPAVRGLFTAPHPKRRLQFGTADF